MTFNFASFPERKSTESIKWNYYDEDVLPMWVADMDFTSPPAVLEALHERVDHGIFGYPCELKGLKDTILERLESQYHWHLTAEDIVYVPGVVSGFNWVAQSITRPGDGMIIQTPVYPPFISAFKNAGLVQQEMELTAGSMGQYEIDFERFGSAFDSRSRLFLLCNPHNPIGRVFTRTELEGMAEECLQRDVLNCSEEIHCDLIISGHEHIPIATLAPEIAERTITLMAPSKTFNIAGLEFSFAVVTNPELREALKRGRRGVVGHPNLLGMVAAKAAYQSGNNWLVELMKTLENNRNRVHETVEGEMPGIQMSLPQATYLAWLDCRAAGIGDDPADFFLKNARVGLNDGRTFGKGGEGFVRLNFGCPESMLSEALDRMCFALLIN